MKRSVRISAALVFAILGLCAVFTSNCVNTEKLPGNESLGSYSFHAEPSASDCTLGGIPDGGFDFDVTLTRNRDGTGAWLTLGDVSGALPGIILDAGFDGQVFTSINAVSRTFTRFDGGSCGLPAPDGGSLDCPGSLEESLVFALLSETQSKAVGNVCPPNPLDGGIPTSGFVDESSDGGDGGLVAITPPGETPVGFDTVRVCGTMVDLAVNAGDCMEECLTSCQTTYVLTGARK